jgi:hypothetical protein
MLELFSSDMAFKFDVRLDTYYLTRETCGWLGYLTALSVYSARHTKIGTERSYSSACSLLYNQQVLVAVGKQLLKIRFAVFSTSRFGEHLEEKSEDRV